MRPVSVRYLGFKATEIGREYSLDVDGEGGVRSFVVIIPHAAFAARHVRFQDAPDLCFAKVQRELDADPLLVPGAPFVVSDGEIAVYAESQVKRSPDRKKRAATPVTPATGA